MVAGSVLGAGVAAADAEPTVVAFSQLLRRCDFSEMKNVGGDGYGRPVGAVRLDGGELVADVAIATARPNTGYDVRIIQVPRPSERPCNPGDPGVAAAALNTDGAGAGAVTVRGPVVSGATGAWLFITRPNAHSQVPAEFYSTDFIFAF